MALSKRSLAVVLMAAMAGVQAHPKCGGSCAADECFAKPSLPAEYMPTLSSFCYEYLSTTPGVVTQSATTVATVTSTETVTETITGTGTLTNTATDFTTTTPSADPATVTTTETTVVPSTTTIGTTCTVTSTTSLTTSVAYTTRGQPPSKRTIAVSDVVSSAAAIPTALVQGCKAISIPSKVSSACSCILATAAPSTTTVTVTTTTTIEATGTATASATATDVISTTVTDVSTAPTAAPATVTATVTSFSVVTEQPCTSTSTSFTYNGDFSCGIPSPSTTTSGLISCTDPAPPLKTNNRFRIEGNDAEGTVFEGCIISGPENITTPSGGTHLCDGTNNNNNPAPGATLTTDINDAGMANGFDFDGSYSNQFQDFFITRISASAQTGSQFWGVMRDRVFTSAGGCQEQVIPGTEGLWAFDAFNKNAFLRLSPDYRVVRLGETASVIVSVTATDGNGADDSPVSGASVGGQTSDSNGSVQIQVPDTPGCYQFKATRSGSLRSNAFYLTVLPA